MKTVGIIISILGVVIGISALFAIIENAYALSCILILTLVLIEVIRKILIKNPGDFLCYFSYAGNIVWFIVVPAILLWKIYFYEYGMIGLGTIFIFIIVGLAWFSRNLVNDRDNKNYKGLYLIIASGLIVSVVLLILRNPGENIKYYRLITTVVLLVSYLMATSIEYYNFVNIAKDKMLLAGIVYLLITSSMIFKINYVFTGILVIYLLAGLKNQVRKKWIR